MSTPRTVSTPRSRSFVVTALPAEALSPKTVRMPVRSAPTQPRPASSRVMKAMTPVIVSVEARRGSQADDAVGVLGGLDHAGQRRVDRVRDGGEQVGPVLQHEAEDREGERESGEDREEGEVGHARGEEVTVGAPVALPRLPRPGLSSVASKRPRERRHASTPRQLELVDRAPHAHPSPIS